MHEFVAATPTVTRTTCGKHCVTMSLSTLRCAGTLRHQAVTVQMGDTMGQLGGRTLCACKAKGLGGDCCPTSKGQMLDCCKATPSVIEA